jgi:hypothetical protein
MKRLALLSFVCANMALFLLPGVVSAAQGRGGGGGSRGGGGFSSGYRGGSSGAHYGGSYGGGVHYGGSYYGGYRGGYYGGRYGYGYGYGYRGWGYGGWGFSVGLGWPYYGYGWGYPYGYYSSAYSYPSAAYYPAYDTAPVTYSAPAATPQVNVYTPGTYAAPAPVRERQDPPAGRDSSGRLTSALPNTYLIAFPDGSVQVAVAYWTDNGTLHYVTEGKQQKTVPLSAIDRSLTLQLNHERGIALSIP